jgi:cell division septum initiation protein DivIVA
MNYDRRARLIWALACVDESNVKKETCRVVWLRYEDAMDGLYQETSQLHQQINELETKLEGLGGTVQPMEEPELEPVSSGDYMDPNRRNQGRIIDALKKHKLRLESEIEKLQQH